MANEVIAVRRVTKNYPGGVQALRDTGLTVRRGQIFGLLGANGAGKSTLVKILLTLVNPTRFEGEVLGKPLGNLHTKTKLGYLPEQAQFAGHLTASELLMLAARLQGVNQRTAADRSERLLKRVGLSGYKNAKLETFSKGTRQRLGIAQALINDPELIFLDEPTDGVDPLGRKEIRELILELRDQGHTVFINSHLLDEVETMCDHVAILQKGVVVRQGSIADLTRGANRYLLTVEGEHLSNQGLVSIVTALGGTCQIPSTGGFTAISLPTNRPQAIQPIIDELRKHSIVIVSVNPQKQSLEDFFVSTIHHLNNPVNQDNHQTMAMSMPNRQKQADAHDTMH